MDKQVNYPALAEALATLTSGIPYEIANLANAAALAWEDESRMDAVGERLYKPVAEHCGTTEQTVERLIRHAVESAMDTVGVLRIYGFFGNTIDPMRGKPTNAEMIGMLAQHMRVTSAD